MLSIALQFYGGDWYKAMKLARLLADVEQNRRDDIALMFVRTDECPKNGLITETIRRCAEIFQVEDVILHPDTPEHEAKWWALNKWPIGCNILWAGAISHFLKNMDPRWTTIFTVDGGDGVPLHREWANLMIKDHLHTLHSNLEVTGRVFKDGLGRWHANGNMVIERSFVQQHPEVLDMPDDRTAWDVWHADKILPHCRSSSAVRCDWKVVGLQPDVFPLAAKNAAWWHGYKDGHFVDMARKFIFSGTAADLGNASPTISDFGRADMLAAGNPQIKLEAPLSHPGS